MNSSEKQEDRTDIFQTMAGINNDSYFYYDEIVKEKINLC